MYMYISFGGLSITFTLIKMNGFRKISLALLYVLIILLFSYIFIFAITGSNYSRLLIQDLCDLSDLFFPQLSFLR